MKKKYEKFKINKIITDDKVIRLKKPAKVGVQIKDNVDEVFKNAIKKGMKDPDSWMYMYSEKGKDYFKHCDTRCYKAYPQVGMMEAIKKKLHRER